jgi:hypothetical protein
VFLVPDPGKTIKRIVPVFILVLILLFYFFDPGEGFLFPRCPFNILTGYYCPGCGSQRAIHSLLHFRFGEAAGQNLLIIPSAFVIFYHLIYRFLNKKLGWKLPDLLYRKNTPWIILAVVILFWIFRNIPVEPFRMLAPG